MSKQIETGGQAFPRVAFEGETSYGKPHDGMTMRDYFAAGANIDVAAALKIWGDENLSLLNDNTRAAFMGFWTMLRYEYADAMLAERKKGQAVAQKGGAE